MEMAWQSHLLPPLIAVWSAVALVTCQDKYMHEISFIGNNRVLWLMKAEREVMVLTSAGGFHLLMADSVKVT